MATFNLKSISLLEVNFFREGEVPDDDSEYTVQVRLSRIFKDSQLQVNVILELSKMLNDIPIVSMKVDTAGMFEIIGEIDQVVLENFANINGPAIIYPFIRETVASLSSKAGISTILLPPLNFVEMAERNRQNSSQLSQ